MLVKYNSSVHTAAGFRSVTITAEVERISAKRVQVRRVIEIDGAQVTANMSRTGANRQRYYGLGVAKREENRTKNLSSCEVLED